MSSSVSGTITAGSGTADIEISITNSSVISDWTYERNFEFSFTSEHSIIVEIGDLDLGSLTFDDLGVDLLSGDDIFASNPEFLLADAEVMSGSSMASVTDADYLTAQAEFV